MRVDEYLQHDAVGRAALVRSKEVTSTELLEAAIERAAQVDPALNAINLPMYDEGRRASPRPPPPAHWAESRSCSRTSPFS